MTMVEFNHTVKYGGVFHAPHASVEVKDEHVEELIAIGAKVLLQTPQDTESPPKPIDKKPEKKTPYKIPAPKQKG